MARKTMMMFIVLCIVAVGFGGRNRPTFGPDSTETFTTIEVTSITNVTEIVIVDGGKIGNSGKGNVKFNDTDSELYILDGDLGIGTEVLVAGTKVTTTEDTPNADLYVEFQADAGADNSDLWRHHYADGGFYTLESYATGSWVVVSTVTNAGLFTPISMDTIPSGLPQYLRPNIFDPLAVHTLDTQVCFIPLTPAALTITNIKITLDAAGNEIAGDLKYADTFIGLANPTVINICDTTSGVLDDSAMGTATVPSGKCVYFEFDSAPHTDITQMSWIITFDYD